MADSTAQMTIAAWGQVVLSIIAVVLVGVTARYAYRAAIAAETINAITGDTAERQLRAYVHPTAVNLEMEESGHIKASLTFKNAGQTPAYEFECKYSLTFSHNLRSPGPADIEHARKGKSIATLQPNGTFHGQIIAQGDLIPEFLRKLADQELAMFVHGRLTYRDAFKNDQITNFRYVYSGPWGGKKPLNVCEEGNDAT